MTEEPTAFEYAKAYGEVRVEATYYRYWCCTATQLFAHEVSSCSPDEPCDRGGCDWRWQGVPLTDETIRRKLERGDHPGAKGSASGAG